MITPELAAFLEEGININLGTRNASLEPAGCRALAAKVSETGTHIVVYLPALSSGPVLENLRANGQGAVLFGRPVDDRSCQVKGTFVSVRDGRDDERPMVEAQWAGFVDNLGQIGIPRAIFASWTTWPVVAVTLEATALFEQTPGPLAGQPL